MRKLYLTYVFIFQLILLAGAVLIPIYLTPGYYWWTAFFLMLLVATSANVSKRIDEWNEIDRKKK